MEVTRKTNVFERLLLLVGFAIAIIGFYLLNAAYVRTGKIFSIDILMTFFLWLLLIFIMILCAINENQREELGIIITESVKETRILRDISKEHLEEIKLMRMEMKRPTPTFSITKTTAKSAAKEKKAAKKKTKKKAAKKQTKKGKKKSKK